MLVAFCTKYHQLCLQMTVFYDQDFQGRGGVEGKRGRGRGGRGYWLEGNQSEKYVFVEYLSHVSDRRLRPLSRVHLHSRSFSYLKNIYRVSQNTFELRTQINLFPYFDFYTELKWRQNIKFCFKDKYINEMKSNLCHKLKLYNPIV